MWVCLEIYVESWHHLKQKIMQWRKPELCQNSLLSAGTAQTPRPHPGWSLVPPTAVELPASPGLLDVWSGVGWGEELAEPSALKALRGTTFHEDPTVRRAPYGSISVLRSTSIDDLDAWLHEDTAGYPKAKQLPFLVVSLCFFYLPWKALARQYFVEGWGGEFINCSCAGLIVVLQTIHFTFNNNLRFRQDVYSLLSLLLKDYMSFWMFLL